MDDTMSASIVFHDRNRKTMLAFMDEHAHGIPILMDDLHELKNEELSTRIVEVREEWNAQKRMGTPLSQRLNKWVKENDEGVEVEVERDMETEVNQREELQHDQNSEIQADNSNHQTRESTGNSQDVLPRIEKDLAPENETKAPCQVSQQQTPDHQSTTSSEQEIPTSGLTNSFRPISFPTAGIRNVSGHVKAGDLPDDPSSVHKVHTYLEAVVHRIKSGHQPLIASHDLQDQSELHLLDGVPNKLVFATYMMALLHRMVQDTTMITTEQLSESGNEQEFGDWYKTTKQTVINFVAESVVWGTDLDGIEAATLILDSIFPH
ncbi:hypothetical protein P280DRAFT_513124 [Massarina eburnea CBS 473.64]|uniref:Uncharacterized protein n=1 Tax=Massarina eburnea CBS 473.64 TaxID=1395130 RepID=A0A6A6SBQ7_9PLEO|nr:hypothetical protein P280DRAFT_513124 [Massarina eburnea CBS 473.64]